MTDQQHQDRIDQLAERVAHAQHVWKQAQAVARGAEETAAAAYQAMEAVDNELTQAVRDRIQDHIDKLNPEEATDGERITR